jgi:hypothetical protein
MYKRQFLSNIWFPMSHYIFWWKSCFFVQWFPAVGSLWCQKNKWESNNANCMLFGGWKLDQIHHPKLQQTLGFVFLSFEKTIISKCQGRVHWQCCIIDPQCGRWIYEVRLSCGWTMQPKGWRLWNGLAQHFYGAKLRELHMFATSPYETKGDKACHIWSLLNPTSHMHCNCS